jgi:hypothetical protein
MTVCTLIKHTARFFRGEFENFAKSCATASGSPHASILFSTNPRYSNEYPAIDTQKSHGACPMDKLHGNEMQQPIQTREPTRSIERVTDAMGHG